jgi:hypothetical protein
MSHVYRVDPHDGSSVPLQRVRCRNEDRELQRLLELNPDLLPGAQIDPEVPRRWMLIKREKQVPDPSSGLARWSVDMLFVDQDARPTFVECKRHDDTRSRREVVAQMLDYAANGPFYWTKEEMRSDAAATAAARGSSLEAELSRLLEVPAPSIEEFFDRFESNLREAQVRLVFFLEEAPQQLKSLVEFLNRQMERTEVVIVEARQYEDSHGRVVVPSLFGFTEEARLVKKVVTVTDAADRRTWDVPSFLAAVDSRVPQAAASVRALLEAVARAGCSLRPGAGKSPSVNIDGPGLKSKALLAVESTGDVMVNLGSFRGTATLEAVRARLRSLVPNEKRDDTTPIFPRLSFDDWKSRIAEIEQVARDAIGLMSTDPSAMTVRVEG